MKNGQPEASQEQLYEEKLYTCKLCHQDNVRKKKETTYAPQYCDVCRKKIHSENFKLLHKTQFQKKLDDKLLIRIALPDGSIVSVRDEEEQQFFDSRFKSYTTDFTLIGSSDMGLLSRIIMLEIEMNRINRRLVTAHSNSPKMALILTKVMEEYRKSLSDLGVSRANRLKDDDKESPGTIINNMISKFRSFQKEHPEKFLWKCCECGKINKLNYINPDCKKEELKVLKIIKPKEIIKEKVDK